MFVVAGAQNAVCDWRPARGEHYLEEISVPGSAQWQICPHEKCLNEMKNSVKAKVRKQMN